MSTKNDWQEKSIDWQEPDKPEEVRHVASGEERRVITGGHVRAMVEDGQRMLTGYAATYNTLSRNLDKTSPWYERILSGAFEKTLRGNPDVRFTVNHNPDAVMGRTKAGTLSLSSDKTGLLFRCMLPDTEQARALHTACARGDMSDCSFTFNDPDCTWDEEMYDEDDDVSRSITRGSRITVRNIRGFGSISDVACVAAPAYPGTSIQARSIEPIVLAVPPAPTVEPATNVQAETFRAALLARRRRVIDQLMG
jgi:uncharacterized protein